LFKIIHISVIFSRNVTSKQKFILRIVFLKLKNTEIYFESYGVGKPLILLHGILECSQMWDFFIQESSKYFKVITVDLLGHGKTSCVDETHSMSLMAEALSMVLIRLGIINKISIIGHSMGGYVGLAFAEKYPNKTKDLCLMNSTFLEDDSNRKQLRTRAVDMAEHHYENLIRMSFINLFSEESKSKYKSEIEDALLLALKTPLQGFKAAQNGMRIRPNRFDIFKNIEGKKLIIHGKKDSLININEHKKVIENTDISIIELPEGHMSHIENKNELTRVLKSFLNF